ncbi:MAG: protein rep [Candidatus Udaeobacter sp.]
MRIAQSDAITEARTVRKELLDRLIIEEEQELASKLEKCGNALTLICSSCGNRHFTETRCKQKWCPVCVRAIATKRSLKFAAAAEAMQWPLFLTLTVENVKDTAIPFVRKLRRDFGRLRHRRLWKVNVRGGVAAIEVTNKGKGWHPHLHALIDCRWLAIKTPRPQAGESSEHTKQKLRAAKHELTNLWKKVTREKFGVCWLQRASGIEAAREVLKYSVKGSDLIESPDPIGPLIHQLCATRLTTSFGSLFGKHLTNGANEKTPVICDACGNFPEWIPEELVDNYQRKTAVILR